LPRDDEAPENHLHRVLDDVLAAAAQVTPPKALSALDNPRFSTLPSRERQRR